MTQLAVFLRAVNVGGNNMVPMDTLRDLASGLGYTDVATYLQSGNLVCDVAATKPAEVEQAIHAAIHAELRLSIDVMARTREELLGVIDGNPFETIADDPKKLHVSFLTRQPAAAAVAACDPDEFSPERYVFGDRCIYLWLPRGAGHSKLAKTSWAQRLAVPGTARNWRTLTIMANLLGPAAG